MIKRTLLSLTFMLLMALAVVLLTLPSLPEEAKGNEWEFKKNIIVLQIYLILIDKSLMQHIFFNRKHEIS